MKRITATRKITSGHLAGIEVPWFVKMPDSLAAAWVADFEEKIRTGKEEHGVIGITYVYVGSVQVEEVE